MTPSPSAVIPRLSGVRLLGALIPPRQSMLQKLIELGKEHETFQLDVGGASIVMLTHPEDIERVMVGNMPNYRKTGPFWESLSEILGTGIATSEGDLWKRQRRMLHPHLHGAHLKEMCDDILEVIDANLDTWTTPERNVSVEFSRITMSVLLKTVFKERAPIEEQDRIAGLIPELSKFALLGSMYRGFPTWMPRPGLSKFEYARTEIKNTIATFVARARQDEAHQGSILKLLCDMVDVETGERMSEQQLHDEALALFLTGHDTTTILLTWVLAYVVRNPEVLAALGREVRNVVGDGKPTFEQLRALPYMRSVINETLRLRPPVWLVPRTAQEDDTLRGRTIKAGTTVGCFLAGLHHHPEHWQNPERFDPSRFTTDGRQVAAFKPWGAGQRLCLGRDLATTETTLALIRLFQRFDVQPTTAPLPEMALDMRTAPEVTLELSPRKSLPV